MKTSWLRRIGIGITSPGVPRPSRPRRGRPTTSTRPGVEQLEDRNLPSQGWLNPIGSEFRVNTTVADTQVTTSSVTAQPVNATAADGQGNFVVVWQGNGPGDADGIFAQRYDPAGAPLDGEVRVNTTIAGVQDSPLVARAATNSQYVVSWTSGNAVWGRLYDADGTPRGTGEFRVSGGTGFAYSVAMDASGDFVILYKTPTQKGGFDHYTWLAQRYNAAGAAQGRAITVDSPRLINGVASVAMNAGGAFVVVWDEADNGSLIYAQRYRADGRAVGSRIQVNTNPAGPSQWCSSVAMDSVGNFVVTWVQILNNSWMQRFNADGTRSGAPLQFSANSGQNRVAMALQDDGDVVLGWTQDEVYVQVFTAAGVSRGDPLLVNTTTAGMQNRPSVALNGSGHVVVVWTGNGVGDDAGVFGQRYTAAGAALGGEFLPSGQLGGPAAALAAPTADSRVVPFKVSGGGNVPNGLPVFPGGTAPHDATGTATHLGRYTGEGVFTLLTLNPETLTGMFTGFFVFVAANGDRLTFRYGAETPGTFTVTPTADGKVVVQFVADFTPVAGESTGRFANVTGGSFTMIATTEPFVLQPNDQGYTVPFRYTWEGGGWIEFGKGK